MSGDLDRLLDAWAERSRLTEAQSAVILEAVVGAREPELDAAWWLDLVGRVSGMIVQVTALPEAARTAMLPPLAAVLTTASAG